MKVKIAIIGDRVHDIGYRYFLMENAMMFGVEGFKAVNLVRDKQVVQVFLEGEEDRLGEFSDFAKTTIPLDAEVERIDEEDYEGFVPRIENFALIFNVGQSGKFIREAKEVEKAIREESERTRDEIGAVRSDIRSYLDSRFDHIEHEISRIKETIGMK